MAERLNGGPWALNDGDVLYVDYWWGSGDDRHLAYASAHPVEWIPDGGPVGEVVSFDQRASIGDQGKHVYGVTVRCNGPGYSEFDLYAATP